MLHLRSFSAKYLLQPDYGMRPTQRFISIQKKNLRELRQRNHILTAEAKSIKSLMQKEFVSDVENPGWILEAYVDYRQTMSPLE